MARLEEINLLKKLSKNTPISDCEQSRSFVIDLIFLIAVIGSCGFLILEPVMDFISKLKHKVISDPMVYGLSALAIVTTTFGMLVMSLCKNPKCGQPGCRGLRKTVEFDIQIETEDSMANSDSVKHGSKKWMLEMPKSYHKELETMLKKMAPVNGRAILVFRGRCGCVMVRVEVPGPKKNIRKMKN